MNARITTIALTILAGTITASAQQRQQRSQHRQKCPACSAKRDGQQRQQFNQGRRPTQRTANKQQYRHQGRRPQNPRLAQQQQQQIHGHKQHTPDQFAPQQRQRFRQQALERFDHDGDGQLSKLERKHMKQSIQQRRRSGNRHKRPESARQAVGEE